jgi:hypothetical protein
MLILRNIGKGMAADEPLPALGLDAFVIAFTKII